MEIKAELLMDGNGDRVLIINDRPVFCPFKQPTVVQAMIQEKSKLAFGATGEQKMQVQITDWNCGTRCALFSIQGEHVQLKCSNQGHGYKLIESNLKIVS